MKKGQTAAKPLNRCIVGNCKMNHVTHHQGKSTFKSIVGIEIQEVFPRKEDDAYIDELISKKLNLNNFYDVQKEDQAYFAEFEARKNIGVIEERLLKTFDVTEKVCGFHQFFMLKHKELQSALQNCKSFNK